MKKVNGIIRLLFTLGLCISCLFGYVNVNSKVIVEEIPEEKIVQEEIWEEEIVEEEPIVEEVIVEETIKEEVVAPVVPETPVAHAPQVVPVVSTPEVSRDKITVGGVTNSLMKDPDGTHYYLSHDENGVENGIGVPYIDYRYNFMGRKTIIYAHSLTRGNGPFQVLQNYHNNYNFYQNNRYIEIDYQGKHYTYEIFSVYVSVADSEESEGLEYFHRDYYTSYSWYETLLKYKNNSEYDTGVEVSKGDKILILQTCSMDPLYYEKYYRYNLLVMGKLVME